MVQLECTVFCPMVEALSLKRASTASAQASTSWVLPRSSSARNDTPENRPAMSLGPRCDLSVAAYSPTQLFAGAHAHVLLELGELVGPHQRHETHAAGGRRADAHADGVEQRPAQQQAGGGVALHRVGEVGSELAIVAFPRGHHDAHAGFVLEFARRQHQVELQLRAVAEQRGHFQRVIGPLALAAGDQRALERGMRAIVEQIHQRLADHGARHRRSRTVPARSGWHRPRCLPAPAGWRRWNAATPIAAGGGSRWRTASVELSARSSRNERSSRDTTACTRSVADSDTTSRAPMRMPVAMSPSEICGRTSSIGTCGASWSRTVAACLRCRPRRRRRRPAIRDSAARAPRRGRERRESRCSARVHRPCASGC